MAQQQKRGRIELGWFEAVVLAIGYIASLGIVGAGGFLIGQRAVSGHLGRQERVVRLPISADVASANPDAGGAEPEMTFHEELGQGNPPVREGRIIVPEIMPESMPENRRENPAAKPHDGAQETAGVSRGEPLELPGSRAASVSRGVLRTDSRQAAASSAGSVMEARSGEAEPAASATRGSAERVTAEAAATAQALRLDAVATTPPRGQSPKGQTGEVRSTNSRVSSPPSGVSPEAAATARELAMARPVEPPRETSKGTWSVQVNATKEETTARNLVQRLRERGYDAYIVEQSREGVTWYRVRVGRLQSLETANALVSRIKEREGLPHAFVASD